MSKNRGTSRLSRKSKLTRGSANARRHLTAMDDMVFNAKELTEATDLEIWLMKTSAAYLEKHFPAPKGIGFWWAVETNGSVLNVFNLALSGREGFILHLDKLDDAKLLWAGGEILERYGIPRDPRLYNTDMIIQKHLDNPMRFLQAAQ